MSNKYIERVIEDCKKNNPGEVEFHQTLKNTQNTKQMLFWKDL